VYDTALVDQLRYLLFPNQHGSVSPELDSASAVIPPATRASRMRFVRQRYADLIDPDRYVRPCPRLIFPNIPAISPVTAATRPTRAGRAARVSPFNSWSITKRAESATSCTAMQPRRRFCPTCSARRLGRGHDT